MIEEAGGTETYVQRDSLDKSKFSVGQEEENDGDDEHRDLSEFTGKSNGESSSIQQEIAREKFTGDTLRSSRAMKNRGSVHLSLSNLKLLVDDEESSGLDDGDHDDSNERTRKGTKARKSLPLTELPSRLHSIPSDTSHDSSSKSKFPSEGESSKKRSSGSSFTLSSEKKNDEFHDLFRIIPIEEILISDYSCALHKEIFIHGRLYLTSKHLCFHANIFGWITHYTFSSLRSRDQTYNRLMLFWRNSQKFKPLEIKDVLAYEKMYYLASKNIASVDFMGDEGRFNEDFGKKETTKVLPSLPRRNSALEPSSTSPMKPNLRKFPGSVSEASQCSITSPSSAQHSRRNIDCHDKESQTSAPLKCACSTHYPWDLLNSDFKISLTELHEIIFGDFSEPMRQFWEDDRKFRIIEWGQWRNTDQEHRTRKLVYESPMTISIQGEIGVAMVKSIQNENYLQDDPTRAFVINVETRNLAFTDKDSPVLSTRWCLWSTGFNQTHLKVTGGMSLHGKSSNNKDFIERENHQTILDYVLAMDTYIRRHIKASSRTSIRHERQELKQKSTSDDQSSLIQQPGSIFQALKMILFGDDSSMMNSHYATFLLLILISALIFMIIVFVQLSNLEETLKFYQLIEYNRENQ